MPRAAEIGGLSLLIHLCLKTQGHADDLALLFVVSEETDHTGMTEANGLHLDPGTTPPPLQRLLLCDASLHAPFPNSPL